MSATNCTVMSTLCDVPRGEEMPDNGLPAAWLSCDSSAFHGWTGLRPFLALSGVLKRGEGMREGAWPSVATRSEGTNDRERRRGRAPMHTIEHLSHALFIQTVLRRT